MGDINNNECWGKWSETSQEKWDLSCSLWVWLGRKAEEDSMEEVASGRGHDIHKRQKGRNAKVMFKKQGISHSDWIRNFI